MDECKDCEFRGYSPQVCMLHAKHRNQALGRPRKALSVPVKVSAKTVAGAGVGVAAVVFGSAMVSLVGGATVLHAMLLKMSIGAGLAGGGIGFFKGLTGRTQSAAVKKRSRT